MRGSLWMLAAALIVVALPAAWWTTDVLESDNDFCNACHLPSGEPLHTSIRDDFDRRPAASLAARHAAVRLASRPTSPGFRCIDCHGGTGLLGRSRVKLLSALDSVLYLAGRFDEPDGMTWPLWDEDCRRCHADFAIKGEGFEGQAFHDRDGHNSDLGVACVECHASHEAGADPDRWFLRPDAVRSRCGSCHVEYQRP